MFLGKNNFQTLLRFVFCIHFLLVSCGGDLSSIDRRETERLGYTSTSITELGEMIEYRISEDAVTAPIMQSTVDSLIRVEQIPSQDRFHTLPFFVLTNQPIPLQTSIPTGILVPDFSLEINRINPDDQLSTEKHIGKLIFSYNRHLLQNRFSNPSTQQLSLFNCPTMLTLELASGKRSIRINHLKTICRIQEPSDFYLEVSNELNREINQSIILGYPIKASVSLNIITPLLTKSYSFNFNRHYLLSKLSQMSETSLQTQSRASIDRLLDLLVTYIEQSFSVTLSSRVRTSLHEHLRDNLFVLSGEIDESGNTLLTYRRTPETTFRVLESEYQHISSSRLLVLKSTLEAVPVAISNGQLVQDYQSPFVPPTPREVRFGSNFNSSDLVEFRIVDYKQNTFNVTNPETRRLSNRVCRNSIQQCTAGLWDCVNPEEEQYNCRDECTGGWYEECARYEYSNKSGDTYTIPREPRDRFHTQCVENRRICRQFSNVCDRRRVCSRLVPPASPTLPYVISSQSDQYTENFIWRCTSVSDASCEGQEYEDRWIEYTFLSTMFPNPVLVSRELDQNILDELLSNIKVKINSSTFCSLRELSARALGRSIKFIPDYSDCAQTHNQQLDLVAINTSTMKLNYQCGVRVDSHCGRRTYMCLDPATEHHEQFDTNILQDNILIQHGQETGIWKDYFPKTVIELQGFILNKSFKTQLNELTVTFEGI